MVEAEPESCDTYSFMVLHMLTRSSSQGAGTHLSLERSSISPDPVAGTTENAAKPQKPIQKERGPPFPLKPTQTTYLQDVVWMWNHMLKIHLKYILVPGVH